MTDKETPKKVIIITGTSIGFSREATETLARSGHSVFASMRDIAGKNKNHADQPKSQGIKVVALDVTNDASVENGVSEVLSQAKKLDVVINSAGIASAGVSEAFTADQ